MLRIYCDSNIYRYLNPKHPSFTSSLLNVFEDLKDIMLFSFSDAHLDDLKDSPKEYSEQDLLLMGKYVKDNYFMHDLIGEKKTNPYLATPIETFNNKDYDAYKRTIDNNPFDIDNLFKEFGNDPYIEILKGTLKSLFALPVPAIGMVNENEMHSNELVNKMIPNYNENMSIGDLINDVWPYTKALMNDENELSNFRRYIASYLNRDDFSFEQWGLGFNERLKRSPIGKSFMDMIDDMLTGTQKDDSYQKFNRAYNFLELYNITQERSGKKLKKFDYESLNIDALHAWYASFSDYLVTDDKGLQVKASIMYHLFKIPTKILSSKDFVNMKSILLGQEETLEKFIDSFVYDIKHSMQLYERVDPFKNEIVKTFKTTHSYFNYFNRYQIIQSSENTVWAFYCDRGGHGDFFMYREIELLTNKLIDLYGLDDEKKGKYNFEERKTYKTEECIRSWHVKNFKFSLQTSSPSWGTTISLGIIINSNK